MPENIPMKNIKRQNSVVWLDENEIIVPKWLFETRVVHGFRGVLGYLGQNF